MRFENYQAMSIVPTLVGMIVEPNLASNQDCPRLKTLAWTIHKLADAVGFRGTGR
jgi:hypothetical protein